MLYIHIITYPLFFELLDTLLCMRFQAGLIQRNKKNLLIIFVCTENRQTSLRSVYFPYIQIFFVFEAVQSVWMKNKNKQFSSARARPKHRRWTNVWLLLGQRRRRWPNNNQTLGRRFSRDLHTSGHWVNNVYLCPMSIWCLSTFSIMAGPKLGPKWKRPNIKIKNKNCGNSYSFTNSNCCFTS